MDTIWFPGLGNFHITISNIAFSIFGFKVYWYGVIIATGFLLAVVLGMRAAKKYGIDPDSIIDLVLVAAPVSIVTARIYYVIFSLNEPNSIYLKEPLEIVKIWHGGLAIYGGIIGAVTTAYIFARVKKIKVLNLFDFGVPYLVLAQAIGRWGNFVNREAYGGNTNLPWGMTSDSIKEDLKVMKGNGMDVNPDLPVHPAFLYESLWNFGVFFFLIWYRRNKKKADGEVFCLYMILYGAGRFFIEGLRTDSLMLGSLRISQILALVFVIAFSIVLFMIKRNSAGLAVENVSEGSSKYSSILESIREDAKADEDSSMEEKEGETESTVSGDGTSHVETPEVFQSIGQDEEKSSK